MAIGALVAASVLTAPAQRGLRGPDRNPGSFVFSRYPFDRWAAENAKPQIRWSVRTDSPHLSPHQRLLQQIDIAINGSELRSRPDNTQIIAFLRIEDAKGTRYQYVNVARRAANRKQIQEIDFHFPAFILPGDYTLSLAICDSRTLEHSFLRRQLHIASMNQDALSDAWEKLPAVEFIPVNGIPDSWYIPQIPERLSLPLETSRPTRVELLLNTTPAVPGTISELRQNMQDVVPSLKVLMGIAPAQGAIGLSIVDLARRAFTYEEPDLRATPPPEWARRNLGKFRAAFAETRTTVVDVKTLEGQRRTPNYLSIEVARLLGPQNPTDAMRHVVIVLSAPFYFNDQDKPPLPDLPADPARRLFYISYSPLAVLQTDGVSGLTTLRVPLYRSGDDIEHTLKPMGARVFHVSRPEEFRKALAAILAEISAAEPAR
jgi:hypothetical protein